MVITRLKGSKVEYCYLCAKPLDKGVAEVCHECKLNMQRGIVMIQVADNEKGTNPKRTGPYCVITEDIAVRAFNLNPVKQRAVFVEKSLWEKTGLPTSDVSEV